MRFFALCIGTLLLLTACSSTGETSTSVAAADAATEDAAPAPDSSTSDSTVAPDPTAVPDPTDIPEPTAVPETETESVASGDSDGLFPIVVDATASTSDGMSWNVNVTLSSEYDSPERYADAWRVVDADGNELGVRVLTHDHANEQPFTRSHTVDIAEDVTTVFIEGRDQLNGWAGELFELTLAR